MSEAAWLFDVNALIALMSPGHVHHDSMHNWFRSNSNRGWATCPITENGAVRVLSQSVFAKGVRRPSELIEMLRWWKESQPENYQFWADEISLTDESVFKVTNIASPKLVTDSYLLGLAAKHNARLVSFDRTLPWQAIRSGTARLVEIPLLQ